MGKVLKIKLHRAKKQLEKIEELRVEYVEFFEGLQLFVDMV